MLFDKIEKHLSTLLFVAVVIILLIAGYYATIGSSIAKLRYTAALVVSMGLSVFALLLFDWTNGKLFYGVFSRSYLL